MNQFNQAPVALNISEAIITYVFSNQSALADFESALNTYVSSMRVNQVKNVEVEFTASSGLFQGAKYIGMLSKTTDIRAQVTLQKHNGMDIIHGIQNGTAWSWDSLALKSKIVTEDNSPLIPTGSDFNSYTNPGTYLVQSDSDAGTMSNIPRYSSGRLIVIYRPRAAYMVQYYIPSTSAVRIYARNYNNGTWTAWGELAAYSEGTWTPKLYDYETYVRDFPSSGDYRYSIIGNICIARISTSGANFSNINTMIQIRNTPMSGVWGGTCYIGGYANKPIFVQGSGSNVYLRPNIKSSDFTDPSNPGIVQFTLFGNV